MNSIPIFDSLTHPMPNGNWISSQYDGQNSLTNLLSDMKKYNVQWTLAVGMGSKIGAYKVEDYASFIRRESENIFPVAFVDFALFNNAFAVVKYLKKMKSLGYIGIKIHPRLSRVNLSNPLLPVLIKEANQLGLVAMLCTYFWSKDKRLCSCNTEQLLKLLCEVPDEKMILVHGGGVRLLEVVEIARQFKSILVDLSFTLCKYEGSSIDLDISYLFKNFDLRICIGSDSPEISLSKLRERYNEFSVGLNQEKRENIAYRNLQKYIGLSL